MADDPDNTQPDLHDGFEMAGFLCEGVTSGIPNIRSENADWFDLADDVNAALMRAADMAVRKARTTNWSREAVATRLLLRSCGGFQGVMLLTERGMVSESRTLARGLIENSFCLAALVTSPDEFLKMVKEDSDASRRMQADFIIKKGLGGADLDREKLAAAVEAMDRMAKIMSPKTVAGLGPTPSHYLTYQRLSDDSAHASARSLNRHVQANEDRTGWSYRWGVGSQGENSATLHAAIMAAIFIGIAITQLLEDSHGNGEFAALSKQFEALPATPPI